MSFLDTYFSRISDLVQLGSVNDASTVYHSMQKDIAASQLSTQEKGMVYAEIANFMFQLKDYFECINNLKKAQENNFPAADIEQFVYNVFILPNLQEFKDNYDKAINALLEKGKLTGKIPFEDLGYYFIPTFVDNRYFIFNRQTKSIENQIIFNPDGKFHLTENDVFADHAIADLKNLIKTDSGFRIIENDVFADYMVMGLDNLNDLYPIISIITAEGKKVYILPGSFNKFLSFFQFEDASTIIRKNIVIFKSGIEMEEYFSGTGIYLPRNIVGSVPASKTGYKLIDEIHEKRLTPEGRFGDNVFLTIAIPSFNRGDRALETVLNCLKSKYDEEIEVVISDNGTKNETQEYYSDISKLTDSRVQYSRYDKNMGFSINLCTVLKRATGEFILTLSDEDKIILDQLPLLLKTLKFVPEHTGIIRFKSDGQVFVPSTKLTSPGYDSLNIYGFTSNYISGTVYNHAQLKRNNLVSKIENNLNNVICVLYPHVFIELFLCQFNSIKGEDLVIINEGTTKGSTTTKLEELPEVDKNVFSIEDSKKILSSPRKKTPPVYMSLKYRLEQFNGWLELINQMELCRKDSSVFAMICLKVAWKTLHLLKIKNLIYYSNDSEKLTRELSKAKSTMLDILLDQHRNRLVNPQQFEMLVNSYHDEMIESVITN